MTSKADRKALMTAAQLHEANLASPSAGVRWQAQMEDHLTSVRTLTSEAMLPGVAPEQSMFRAGLAQAHATAALALALANGAGDLELVIGNLSPERLAAQDDPARGA